VELLAVCPEVEGGLSVPRPPAEIVGERILRQNGEDVTAPFKKGVTACSRLAREAGVRVAILKERSPSCGCGQVYDGSFSGKLVAGDGVFTRELKAMGIECIPDESVTPMTILRSAGSKT